VAELAIELQRLEHAWDLPLPAYASAGAAGMDLMAAIPADAPIRLLPMARVVVPTGFCIAVPPDHEAQVRARSGLAAKHGIMVLNAPGTIDSDYRGEIKVILANLGAAPVVIERGMRIAQLVVAPVARILWKEIEALTETPRGVGGFGSTGVAPATGGQG
jgi:dUTP pyrophosphatase